MSGRRSRAAARLLLYLTGLPYRWFLPIPPHHPMAYLCAVEDEGFARFTEPTRGRCGGAGRP
ncbi:hypothetical protein [Streptomyces longispororuber]|uniref:hypothetical protein n=1 Tax=Streptomyces longispororuber TaxID=68230 RepID=UPI0036F6E9C4